MGGFIEELEGNADGSDEMIDVDDDDEQVSDFINTTKCCVGANIL